MLITQGRQKFLRFALRIIELRGLADGVMAVGRRIVISLETAVNDAFAMQTCDIRDVLKCSVVFANRTVRSE